METVEIARKKWIAAMDRVHSVERKLKKVPLYVKLKEEDFQAEIDRTRGLLRNDIDMVLDAKKRRGEVLKKLQGIPLYIAYEEALREAQKVYYNFYMARKSA